MTITCMKCGEPIDAGHYKDEDEKEHDLDNFHKGDAHMTVDVRRGFRQAGGGFGRLHVECFEETFDVTVDLPGWAE